MSEAPPNKNSLSVIDTTIRLLFIFLLLYWCLDIMKPFIMVVTWAGIIAVTLYPVLLKLEKWLGGNRKLAATIITIMAVAMLVVPTVFLSKNLLASAKELSEKAQSGEIQINPPPPNVAEWPIVGEKLHTTWASASQNMSNFLIDNADQIKEIGQFIASKVASTGLTILMMTASVIIAGVLLTGAKGVGESMIKFANRIAGKDGHEYVTLAQKTVMSVTKGVLGVAIIQTVFAAIGLLVIGIPFASVLAMICLLLSIMQLGPGLVTIPAIIYVFSTHGTVTAVIFMIYMIAVTLCDNVLKPILLGRGAPVPMMVIFLGVIGGFMTGGFIGLFVGAVIISLTYSLFIKWLNTDSLPA